MDFNKPVDTERPEPQKWDGTAFFALAVAICALTTLVMLIIKLGLILFT